MEDAKTLAPEKLPTPAVSELTGEQETFQFIL